MNGVLQQRSFLLTAGLLPGLSSLVFFFIEFVYILENSSHIYSFVVIMKLLFMWIIILTPLTFLGSKIGFNRPGIEVALNVNPEPSLIPPQPKFLSRYALCIIGGVLPFVTILMELQNIMVIVWDHSLNPLHGYTLFTLILFIIACANISILLTYLQLYYGNHQWWWNAFYSSGFCGVYIFAYGFFYWLFYLQYTDVYSAIIYFGFMGIASFTIFLLCGSIGFIASHTFIQFLYSRLKDYQQTSTDQTQL